MAQSVRRPETLGAMDREPQRDKARTSYFGNVKTRSGLVNCLDYLGRKERGESSKQTCDQFGCCLLLRFRELQSALSPF